MPNRNAHAAHQTSKTANDRARRKPTKEVATEIAMIATRQTRSLKSMHLLPTPVSHRRRMIKTVLRPTQRDNKTKEKTKPKKQKMSRIRLSSVGIDLALSELAYLPAVDGNRSLKISFHLESCL